MAELLETFVSDDPEVIPNAKSSKEKATEALMRYAKVLVKKGLATEYGVSIKQVPLTHLRRIDWPWAVYLHHYQEKSENVEEG